MIWQCQWCEKTQNWAHVKIVLSFNQVDFARCNLTSISALFTKLDKNPKPKHHLEQSTNWEVTVSWHFGYSQCDQRVFSITCRSCGVFSTFRQFLTFDCSPRWSIWQAYSHCHDVYIAWAFDVDINKKWGTGQIRIGWENEKMGGKLLWFSHNGAIGNE